jgi:hypothetical protein
MTTVKDLDNMTCKFIPVDDLRTGHLTAMGVVTEDPKFSPSRKTVVVTVETHSGRIISDRRSTSAKIAIWV